MVALNYSVISIFVFSYYVAIFTYIAFDLNSLISSPRIYPERSGKKLPMVNLSAANPGKIPKFTLGISIY